MYILKKDEIKSYPPYVAVLMGSKYFKEKDYSHFIEVFEFWGDHCSYTSENDYWEGETHFAFYGIQPIDVNFEFKLKGENMGYFRLNILFTNQTMKSRIIKRFSDLSTHKANFYYYEEPHDERGKGTTIKRDDVACIECEILR